MLTKPAISAALFLATALMISCAGGDRATNQNTATRNTSTDNTNSAKTNVEELGMLVNIPYETEDVIFDTEDDGKRLIAVLRFSSEDADRIIAELGSKKTAAAAEIQTEPWFPAELIAQSDAAGDKALKGTAYDADLFLQAPYNSGRITRITGSDYFVLEASAQ